jgi:hypothetical protein
MGGERHMDRRRRLLSTYVQSMTVGEALREDLPEAIAPVLCDRHRAITGAGIDHHDLHGDHLRPDRRHGAGDLLLFIASTHNDARRDIHHRQGIGREAART